MEITQKYKETIFLRELGAIKDEKIRNEVKRLVSLCPDYFFTIPASSTGKYHPDYALGEGGLVRHSKAAVFFAIQLLQLEMFEKLQSERDIIIGSLILHDCIKTDGTQYTKAEHPILACKFIEENCINVDIAFKLCDLIKPHMGQWNTDYQGNAILPKPTSPAQKFVHLCDYLASRKNVELKIIP